MGYQRDQSFTGETYRPPSPPRGRPPGTPPPLPPRRGTIHLSPYREAAPPAYDAGTHTYHSRPTTHSWADQDPRQKSTESLVPSTSTDGRRTLLLIYIHGFMGNETSFQSFPAHVHNVLTPAVSATHVVHTKIYPRYKSRRAIEFARDDFSNWLCPHESPETDVILLGHSMGGLLSAEVAILAPYSPADRQPFLHRILGTINFDVPFLGMHPGVIASGIGSLFRPAPESPTMSPQSGEGSSALLPMPRNDGVALPQSPVNADFLQQMSSNESGGGGYFPASTDAASMMTAASAASTRVSSPFTIPVNDPNYNPPFANDVRLPVRKGWDGTIHFIMKHSDGLVKATKSFVTSHLEFGGVMADYPGLKARYNKIRALEDVDDTKEPPPDVYRPPRRVRFVNYYTASTGRTKESSPGRQLAPTRQTDGARSSMEIEMKELNLSAPASVGTRSPSRSPRISIEDPQGVVVAEEFPSPDDPTPVAGHDGETTEAMMSDSSHSMNHMDPDPVADEEPIPMDGAVSSRAKSSRTSLSTTMDPNTLPLPPIPAVPIAPAPFDPTPYTDKDTRKLAEKEHARQMKSYQRAVKDRDAAIKDRRKLIEKKEKNARLAREKAEKAEEKARQKEKKEKLKQESLAVNAEANPKEKNDAASGVDSTVEPLSRGRSTASGDGVRSAPVSPAAHRPSTAERGPPRSPVSPRSPISPRPEKQKRDRKFCMLPTKNPDGSRDPTWVRVFMVGVDEVGAHCGLFIAGKPHYEELVNMVAGKAEEWVRRREQLEEGPRRGRTGSGGN